jgi:hypothetical protein
MLVDMSAGHLSSHTALGTHRPRRPSMPAMPRNPPPQGRAGQGRAGRARLAMAPLLYVERHGRSKQKALNLSLNDWCQVSQRHVAWITLTSEDVQRTHYRCGVIRSCSAITRKPAGV